MIKKEKKMLIPFNLQFFGDNDGNDGGSGNDGNNNQNNNQNQNNNSEKMFTESQVNDMIEKIKNETKDSVIKSLGVSSKDLENILKMANALVGNGNTNDNSNNNQNQNNSNNDTSNNEESDKYKNRAIDAENKLTCLLAGVDKECIDDVLAIAKTKVTDKKDLNKVLEEMKKEERYSSFFGSENDGTGSTPGNSGNGGTGNKGDFGALLAKSGSSNKNNKTSFFS